MFEIEGRHYLIAVDYYSNFIEVDLMTKTTSAKVIAILKKQFARFGIPMTIVSDGGPQFASTEFSNFASSWGITHIMSSPGHPQANGKAESAVKTIKNMIKKTVKDNRDQNEALLELRNTPRQDTKQSPAEMMFGRTTRSVIPEIRKQIKLNEKRVSRKQTVKKCYDKNARTMEMLEIGQCVYFEHKKGDNWRQGKITAILGDRTYTVQDQNGAIYRRNRIHMRPSKIEVNVRDKSPYREIQISHIPNDMNTVPTVANPPIQQTPMVSETASAEDQPPINQPSVARDRPKRRTREPTYLKDFVKF